MARMNFETKRQRAREIEEEIQKLEEELRSLFESPKQEEKRTQMLPLGFSITQKVLEVIADRGGNISKQEIINDILNKYGVELTSGQVQSSVSYLSTQGKIEITGRAIYKLKQ